MFVDLYITYIFGGLPWQALFQRVLSSKSPKIASYVSSISALICILFSIPVIFVGIAAKQTDWESINFTFNASRNDSNLKFMYESDVLPLTIAYLTPPAVKFIGIGAMISATVSSISSSVLAAASLLTQNIYSDLFRPKTSSKEYLIAQIVSTVLIGIVISVVSMLSTSVYTLFGLCSDLIYILLFPQLVLMVYTDFTNSYGVLCGYFTTLVFRLATDTDIKNIFTTNHTYPPFPYKTVSMLIGIIVTVSVSYLSRYLIRNVNPEWDFLKFYRSGKPQCFNQIELNKSETENKL